MIHTPTKASSMAAEAVMALFEATYDLDGKGRRVCRICHAMQHDYGCGHAPGCAVDEGLRKADEILVAISEAFP